LIGRALKNNPTILAAEEALKRAKAFLERREARVSVFERAGIGAEAVDRWVRSQLFDAQQSSTAAA
jgi:hypothetical protein